MLLAMVDDVELATGVLAAMYVGAVAVPSSTMLTGPRARQARRRLAGAGAAGQRAVRRRPSPRRPPAPRTCATLVLTGDTAPDGPRRHRSLTWDDLRAAAPLAAPYPTWDESPALWLYTSGTTGTPKGAMHRHTDIRYVCETYGRAGAAASSATTSACRRAKLFFAYGIGNSLFFPLSVGARRGAGAGAARTRRATAELAERHGVTLFFGGPSFWGPLMAADLPPEHVRHRPQRRVGGRGAAGADVPRRPRPVRLRDPRRHRLHRGAAHLHLQRRRARSCRAAPGSRCRATAWSCAAPTARSSTAPTSRACSTSRATRSAPATGAAPTSTAGCSRASGCAPATSTSAATDGSYTCLGRADDVLKVGGIWVSPTEVEARLLEHPDAGRGRRRRRARQRRAGQAGRLRRPEAAASTVDADEVIAFCRAGLASFKRPRLGRRRSSELPRTATGKIQRFRLRELAAATVAPAPTSPTDVAESQA